MTVFSRIVRICSIEVYLPYHENFFHFHFPYMTLSRWVYSVALLPALKATSSIGLLFAQDESCHETRRYSKSG
jgi:uncharacterized membrane protein YfhO